MEKYRCTAIVLAAGQGKRMNSKIQKQFLELNGYPVLWYSLRCFQQSPLIQDVILVTGEGEISYCKKEIVDRFGFDKVRAVISGGKERYDSVYAGLCACQNTDYVFIHDGARPLVTEGDSAERLCGSAGLRSVCGRNAEQGIRLSWQMRRAMWPRLGTQPRVECTDASDFSICSDPGAPMMPFRRKI